MIYVPRKNGYPYSLRHGSDFSAPLRGTVFNGTENYFDVTPTNKKFGASWLIT